MRRPLLLVSLFVLTPLTIPLTATAQDADPVVDPAAFQTMDWRNIGPFRGGRSVASTGIPVDPHTYYMGTVGGGIWTPAAALGDALLTRLRDRAGLRFDIV